MSFEDLLRRKLGPMRDLVARPHRPEAPHFDPEKLWYRRAVGLEVRVRPEESWSTLELGRVDQPKRERRAMSVEEAAPLLGLTTWTHAATLAERGVRAARAWRWVEQDLAFFAEEDPGVPLTGASGQLALGGRIARRASAWPTPAIETAIEIAPMPFMPRAADLAGAELVGSRFASLERGFEVYGATITGTARTGRTLRRLLPRLDGTRTREALLEGLSGEAREDAERMLGLLDALCLLEAVPGPPSPAEAWARPKRAQVSWLGHAGVLVQASGRSVLVDPLFFARSEPEERGVHPPKPDPRALPPLDAILITHGDNDHLNPASLALLPSATPIYIPELDEKPPPFQVDLRAALRVLGFTDIRELAPWATASIGALTVTACPFEGESWGLPLAKCTYALEAPDLAVFLAADSARMDPVYERLAARGRRFDLALMGVSGNAETYVMPDGFGYGSFYREWVPRVRFNQWVQHCAGPREAVESLALLRPRAAFGYASGGAPFIRTEYSDTGDHAQLAALLAARPELGVRAVELPLGLPVGVEEL